MHKKKKTQHAFRIYILGDTRFFGVDALCVGVCVAVADACAADVAARALSDRRRRTVKAGRSRDRPALPTINKPFRPRTPFCSIPTRAPPSVRCTGRYTIRCYVAGQRKRGGGGLAYVTEIRPCAWLRRSPLGTLYLGTDHLRPSK